VVRTVRERSAASLAARAEIVARVAARLNAR
jgi:hypothetical protein